MLARTDLAVYIALPPRSHLGWWSPGELRCIEVQKGARLVGPVYYADFHMSYRAIMDPISPAYSHAPETRIQYPGGKCALALMAALEHDRVDSTLGG